MKNASLPRRLDYPLTLPFGPGVKSFLYAGDQSSVAAIAWRAEHSNWLKGGGACKIPGRTKLPNAGLPTCDAPTGTSICRNRLQFGAYAKSTHLYVHCV